MFASLSIRWRLTVFHTIVILFIGIFLVGVLMVVTIRGVQTSVEESVERRASQVARLLETGSQPDDASLGAFADDGYLLLVRDADGNVLAEHDNDPARYDTLTSEERDQNWERVLESREAEVSTPSELYGYAVPVETTLSDARVVEVWRSHDEAVNDLVPFLEIVTIAIPTLVLLAIGGSWLMAKSAMAPVNAIVEQAQRMSEDELSERLPVERPRDELGQLASTMNALLGRLEVAFRQREEALEQQRQFVADASHELRTPLTSIEGYARMLRQWGADDPEVIRESAVVIERESVRMRHLVEQLLNLAHGDVGYVLDRRPHDVRELVNEVVAAARMAADGRVRVFAEVPAEAVMVEVDAERIHQLLGILVDNAMKYTPDGGRVTVSIQSPDEASAVVTVEDTGVGIDPRHLPHVFERFYRADTARTTGGSGLGLSIAKQLVDQHGGEISVESTLGEGTAFSVMLPLSPLREHSMPQKA